MASDPADLLDRFRQGEPDAVASAARLARRMVGERGYYIPNDERDDVVQEIVLHAYRAVCEPEFHFTHGFEAFVRSIAHRRCVDWMRRYRSLETLNPGLPSEAPRPDQALISQERTERGARVLGSLGSSCVRLIYLRIRGGLTYREIANRLERSESGVRNQMYRCLKRARDMLAAMDGTHGKATDPRTDA